MVNQFSKLQPQIQDQRSKIKDQRFQTSFPEEACRNAFFMVWFKRHPAAFSLTLKNLHSNKNETLTAHSSHASHNFCC